MYITYILFILYILYRERERERYPIFSGTKSPIFPWDDPPKPPPPERPEECVGVTVHTYVTWPSCLRFFCTYMIRILYIYILYIHILYRERYIYICVCVLYIYVLFIFSHGYL